MNEQGSPAWIEERLGYITASRFADVMTKARSGKGMGKTAESYLIDLLGEHLTRLPASELKTFAMEWGNRWEPVARETYREKFNFDVQQVGFVKHLTERFIGCSPDSLVNAEGVLEIKCPLTAANHVRVLLSGLVPEDHAEQIQGVMWVTGRQWCDFVSYHNNFAPELQLIVIRVFRDDIFISELADSVIVFRNELVSRLEDILELWKGRQAA